MDNAWIFHFPSRRQLNVRRPRNNAWVTHTRTLSAAGLIRNATCSITSGKLRTLPELHGATRADLDAPSVYVPEDLPILTRHELPHVEAALTAEVNELDQLKDRLETSQKSLDIDTLFHMQKTTFPRKILPQRHLIVAAISCTFTILLILYLSLQSKFQCFTQCCLNKNKSPEDATPQSPTSPSPSSEHPTTAVYSDKHYDSVTFATYLTILNNYVKLS